MLSFRHKISFAAVIVCVIWLYFLSFDLNRELRSFRSLKSLIFHEGTNQVRGNSTKTVLYWNTLFGDEHFYFGEENVFNDCPVNDCIATNDRFFLDLEKFDAILFHGNEFDLRDVPRDRNTRQWYVYVNLESPSSRPMPEHVFESYFNLTMTYRLDSDFLWPYGEVVDNSTEEIVAPKNNCSWNVSYLEDREESVGFDREKELTNLIRGKKKAVAWFASNCYANSGRQSYIEELSKYIDVDIYGACGKFNCDKSQDCLRNVVEPRYFFYLAFENSLCRNYVTEKLYKPLRYNVVPIVYGGANYSLFAPPHSYIDALDFESPKDLAIYLKTLIQHPEEYRKYFAWKKQYRIVMSTKSVRCELCKFLHENHKPKVYDNLHDYYMRNVCPLQSLIPKHKYITKTLLENLDYKYLIDRH